MESKNQFGWDGYSLIPVDQESNSIFWGYKNSNKNELVITVTLLIKFLERRGFYSYLREDNGDTVIIKESNNVIERVSERYIIMYLQKYVDRLPGSYYFDGNKNFGKGYIKRLLNELSIQTFKTVIHNLPIRKVVINKDTRGVCYKYFSNVVVKITADDIELLKYTDLEYKVWKDNIINHKFDLVDIYHTAMAYNFHRLVTTTIDIDGKEIVDEARFLALRSALGYLMYNYKNDTDTKAIVFCEEQITDTGGGTGKTLTCKMLEKMGIIMANINGRNVNFNNRFLFQNVNTDTNVILFDDTNDKFDFSGLYSIITNGLTIEKKNKQAIQLSHQDTPKFVITSNTVLTDESNSGKRRKFEVEFSDYFNEEHTPQDEFGCMFFTEWDDYEMNLFYNYMIGNIKLYLEKGLISYESKNLKNRKLSLKIEDDDLLDFCEDICREILTNKVNISSKEIFERWKELYTDTAYKQSIITKSLNTFISINNLKAIKYGYYYIDRKKIRGFVYEPLYANRKGVLDFLNRDNIEIGNNDTNDINADINEIREDDDDDVLTL